MRKLCMVMSCDTCMNWEQICDGKCAAYNGDESMDAYIPKLPLEQLQPCDRDDLSAAEQVEYDSRYANRDALARAFRDADFPSALEAEYTGGSVSYYSVEVKHPTSGGATYTAECNDLIEALGMNYAEGNAFKAIWRRCAARMGKAKAGYKDGLYDAEKVVFFGQRMVAQEKFNK